MYSMVELELKHENDIGKEAMVDEMRVVAQRLGMLEEDEDEYDKFKRARRFISDHYGEEFVILDEINDVKDQN